MTSAYPTLVALTSEESEDRAKASFLDKFWEDYESSRDYLDDQISGFHKRPPRERLDWYEQHEPVFLVPEIVLEMWIILAPEMLTLAPVYWLRPDLDAAYQQQVQMAASQGIDPMTIPPPPPPAYLGQAPSVLSPYWARNWAWNPKEGKRLLRDYANLQKLRDKREEKRMEEALAELPELPDVPEIPY